MSYSSPNSILIWRNCSWRKYSFCVSDISLFVLSSISSFIFKNSISFITNLYTNSILSSISKVSNNKIESLSFNEISIEIVSIKELGSSSFKSPPSKSCGNGFLIISAKLSNEEIIILIIVSDLSVGWYFVLSYSITSTFASKKLSFSTKSTIFALS